MGFKKRDKQMHDEMIAKPGKGMVDDLFEGAAEILHSLAEKGFMGTRRQIVEEVKDQKKKGR